MGPDRDSGREPSGSTQARLLSDRKSRYVFLARIVALVIMIALVALYGLRDRIGPAARPAPTPTSPPPATAESPAEPIPTPAPTLSTAAVTELPDGAEATPAPTPTAVQIVSPDGLAVLELSRETDVIDSSGQLVAASAITVTARKMPMRWEVALVGLGYEFRPEGATLEPPGELTIHYDPDAYYPFAYQDIDCSMIDMARWEDDRLIAPWFGASTDFEAHAVTAEVDQLGTFVIFCQTFGAPISMAR